MSISKTVRRSSSCPSFHLIIPKKNEAEFLQELEEYHSKHSTPFSHVPTIFGKRFSILNLFIAVLKRGGVKKVNESHLWPLILDDIQLPAACCNSVTAIKRIYQRYLETYERSLYTGSTSTSELELIGLSSPGGGLHASSTVSDPEMNYRLALRPPACAFQESIPLQYRHSLHDIAPHRRSTAGLSDNLVEPSELQLLERSLQSGLPNEIELAFNTLLILSKSMQIRLDRCHHLLDLLLATVGIFDTSPTSYFLLYDEWRRQTSYNFFKFWHDTVTSIKGRKFMSDDAFNTNTSASGELASQTTQPIFNPTESCASENQEFHFVYMTATILLNLSGTSSNAAMMATHSGCLRFLFLVCHSRLHELKNLGRDCLAQLPFVLGGHKHLSTHPLTSLGFLVIDLTNKWIGKADRAARIAGMRLLSRLCNAENADHLAAWVSDDCLDTLITTCLLPDVSLLVLALEVCYWLSTLGKQFCKRLASRPDIMRVLTAFISREAQSLGMTAIYKCTIMQGLESSNFPPAFTHQIPPPQAPPRPPGGFPHGPHIPLHHLQQPPPSMPPPPSVLMPPPPPPSFLPSSGPIINHCMPQHQIPLQQQCKISSQSSSIRHPQHPNMYYNQPPRHPTTSNNTQFLIAPAPTPAFPNPPHPSPISVRQYLANNLRRHYNSAHPNSPMPSPPPMPSVSSPNIMLQNVPRSTPQFHSPPRSSCPRFQPRPVVEQSIPLPASIATNGVLLSNQPHITPASNMPPTLQPSIQSSSHNSTQSIPSVVQHVSSEISSNKPSNSNNTIIAKDSSKNIPSCGDESVSSILKSVSLPNCINSTNSSTVSTSLSDDCKPIISNEVVSDISQCESKQIKPVLSNGTQKNNLSHSASEKANECKLKDEKESLHNKDSSIVDDKEMVKVNDVSVFKVPDPKAAPSLSVSLDKSVSQKVVEWLRQHYDISPECNGVFRSAVHAHCQKVLSRNIPKVANITVSEVHKAVKEAFGCVDSEKALLGVGGIDYLYKNVTRLDPSQIQLKSESTPADNRRSEFYPELLLSTRFGHHQNGISRTSRHSGESHQNGTSNNGSPNTRKRLRSLNQETNSPTSSPNSKRRRGSTLQNSSAESTSPNHVLTKRGTSDTADICEPSSPSVNGSIPPKGLNGIRKELPLVNGEIKDLPIEKTPSLPSKDYSHCNGFAPLPNDSCDNNNSVKVQLSPPSPPKVNNGKPDKARSRVISRRGRIGFNRHKRKSAFRTRMIVGRNSTQCSPSSSGTSISPSGSVLSSSPLIGTCSSTDKTPPPPSSSAPQLMCQWHNCNAAFTTSNQVCGHVYSMHLQPVTNVGTTKTAGQRWVCQWTGCDQGTLTRGVYSLVTHVMEAHCSETALTNAAANRKLDSKPYPPQLPPQHSTMVQDNAWTALRRYTPYEPQPSPFPAREGPVTKHMRITAALILRNLTKHSRIARNYVRLHETTICDLAMSGIDACHVLSQCLFELHLHPDDSKEDTDNDEPLTTSNPISRPSSSYSSSTDCSTANVDLDA